MTFNPETRRPQKIPKDAIDNSVGWNIGTVTRND